MKRISKSIISAFLIVIIGISQSAYAYMFWFKSWDNTPENIVFTEKTYHINLPVVGFIFDPRDDWSEATIIRAVSLLGKDRIYHLTISPGMMTAKQVAAGEFDDQYKKFFLLVKQLDINVVFRTMHEMNGGRYPWGSDPVNFQQAWRHVWELSRQVWLTQKNILFDMSVNGWDIPTWEPVPHQKAALFYCKVSDKKRLNCPTFEDYYPGNEYVDIMGMSFYNWWKWNGNYQWLYPNEIINNPQWRTLDRLKAYDKPLFVDEVGTTAVWYPEQYNFAKSQEVYKTNSDYKNDWLLSLKEFFDNEPRILGGIYFNIDLTNWMSRRVHGEEDRSVIDPISEKVYDGIFNVIDGAKDNNAMNSPLWSLFGKEFLTLYGRKVLIESAYRKQILEVIKMANITDTRQPEKVIWALNAQKGNIQANSSLKKFQKNNYMKAIDYAKKFFEPTLGSGSAVK